MATMIFKDTPPTTLAGPITAGATTISVAAGAGPTFPAPGGGEFFYAFFIDAATRTIKELVKVTAVSGDTMTVVRGQGTTSALPWVAGDFFIHGPCAEMFQGFVQTGSGGGSASFFQGTDTSSSGNVVTVPTTNPSITSPSAGNIFFITKGSAANSGSVTCSIGSGPTLPVLYADGGALGAQDWPAGVGAWLYFGPGGGSSFEFLGLSNRAAGEIHYGVAGGTADALTTTVFPPVGVLQDGWVFEIKISSNNTIPNPTIAINGNPPATIVNSFGGALAPGDLVANTKVLMAFNGTSLQLLAPSASQLQPGVPGSRKNLKSVVASDTVINITADAVVLAKGASAILVPSVSVSINTAVSGAGGVDTGFIAVSQPYEYYIGYNPSTGLATAWLTIEGNAPTVPSGYTYYQRYGYAVTDSSGHLRRIMQVNDRWWYDVHAATNTAGFPLAAYGAAGSWYTPGSYVSLSLSGLVPSKSVAVDFVVGGLGAVMISPTTGYGGWGPPSINSNPPYSTCGPNQLDDAFYWLQVNMVTPLTVYYAMQTSDNAIFVRGGILNI